MESFARGENIFAVAAEKDVRGTGSTASALRLSCQRGRIWRLLPMKLWSAMPAALVAALVLSAACTTSSRPQELPNGFVDAGQHIPGLVVEMRYAGSYNFVGRPIAGYETPRCLLTHEAVEALAAVQRDLAASGRGLKVFDCYRPARAVADFAAWAHDPDDQRMKAEFYPNVDKARLFELGYIAERSGHSRGSTLDLTLIDLATGAEADMGTPYDLFDPRSWPSDERVSAAAQANRLALQAAMAARGFRPLREEWWHFTLVGEPYPETYFDFPVR
jgi:zinc D-Ala-D-Ala dipeptidase